MMAAQLVISSATLLSTVYEDKVPRFTGSTVRLAPTCWQRPTWWQQHSSRQPVKLLQPKVIAEQVMKKNLGKPRDKDCNGIVDG